MRLHACRSLIRVQGICADYRQVFSEQPCLITFSEYSRRNHRNPTETQRPVTATALEPSTVIRIPRTLFLKMLEGYPEAAVRLRDSFIARAEHSESDMHRVRRVLEENHGAH